jgi:peptidoglycan/LPS O-acetylase OafA/YrhL
VIFSHALTLGGLGSESIASKTTLGTLAVYGFFGISGYLIAGSAYSNGFIQFLWRRFLRIFPAYWVCLLVTAFVFGAIAWTFTGHAGPQHCGLSCYLSAPNGPLQYVIHNSWLRQVQTSIAGTPSGIPRSFVWNGSAWTLFYEFMCYLILGFLALLGILRRRILVLGLFLAVFLAEIVIDVTPSLNDQFNVYMNWDAKEMLTFVPIFLAGALLYLYRDRIPDMGVLALAATALVLLSLVIPIGVSAPGGLRFVSTDLFAPLLAYPLLWLGIHLPLYRIGARNDYSYGVYIYAYPVQQLLTLAHVQRFGYTTYAVLAVVCTAPLAVGSWWLIEKRALRLKRFQLARDASPDDSQDTDVTVGTTSALLPRSISANRFANKP